MERGSDRRAPAERGKKEGHVKTKNALAIALSLLAALAVAIGAGAEATPAQTAGPAKGKMPGKVILGTLADRYRPVAFDHAKHVGMAGSCAECHHQHEGDRALTCTGCHRMDAAVFRKNVDLARIRPCGGCHPAKDNPGNPGMPTLKAAYHRACIQCHRDVGSVGKDPKGCTETCHESGALARAK